MQKDSTLAIALLTLTAFLPSLQPLAALPQPFLTIPAAFLAIALLMAILTEKLRLPPLQSLLNSPWPTALLITTLTLAAPFLPKSLFLSPNSAFEFLLLPFNHFGLHNLLTPLALAFTAFTLRETNHSWLHTNRLILAIFACLLVWKLTLTGDSLPTFSLMLFSVTLLLTRQRISPLELSALILLLACLSTAAPIFFYLPLLLGFALFAVWPGRGLMVAILGFIIMAALHMAFAQSINLQIQSLPTGEALYAALTFLIIVTIQSLYHWRWWPAPRHAAWGLGAPLLVLALANLTKNPSLADWHGATLLIPALPLVLYTLLRPTYKHS